MSTWVRFRKSCDVCPRVRSLLARDSPNLVSLSLHESVIGPACAVSRPRVEAKVLRLASRNWFDGLPVDPLAVPLMSTRASRGKCLSSKLTRCLALQALAKLIEALARVETQLDAEPQPGRSATKSVERGRYIDDRENEKERDLTGAGTYESPRQTFLRSGVKLFGCVANGSLLGRRRLFHQEAREHRGRSFVEPLLEKSVNFLFQIGRMIQSGKFKRLQCWDGGLLKVLPWRADTSGIHFGGSP